MKTFINSKKIETDGSTFIGSVNTTYEKLVDAFGKETFGLSGDEKSECDWTLKFTDGTIATIYDWKTNKKYRGDKHGISKEENVIWNIGGFDLKAVELVKKELGL